MAPLIIAHRTLPGDAPEHSLAITGEAHVGLRVHCWFHAEATQRAKAALPLDGIVTDWPLEARRLSHRGS